MFLYINKLWKTFRNRRYNIGSVVNDILIALYGTNYSYTCGEQVICKVDESLCCTLETKVTLYVNYTQIKKIGEEGF